MVKQLSIPMTFLTLSSLIFMVVGIGTMGFCFHEEGFLNELEIVKQK